MAQLSLNRLRSNLPMNSRWNVHTRTASGENGHGAWQRARIKRLDDASSMSVKHDAGCVNLAADLCRRTELAVLCSNFEHDHVRLRNQLGTMTGVVVTSIAKYGDSHGHVREIYELFFPLRENLWTHLFREEHGLYSSIVNIERNSLKPYCLSSLLVHAIRVIRREHRYFRKSFQRIADVLGNYNIPKNSGQTYVNLVRGFQELESFKLEHMQKEQVAYSRALALERRLWGASRRLLDLRP